MLSPFLLGMDPFTFLHHLRQMPGLSRTPVVLIAPRSLDESQLQALAEPAAADRGWSRALNTSPPEAGGET